MKQPSSIKKRLVTITASLAVLGLTLSLFAETAGGTSYNANATTAYKLSSATTAGATLTDGINPTSATAAAQSSSSKLTGSPVTTPSNTTGSSTHPTPVSPTPIQQLPSAPPAPTCKPCGGGTTVKISDQIACPDYCKAPAPVSPTPTPIPVPTPVQPVPAPTCGTCGGTTIKSSYGHIMCPQYCVN